MSEQTRNSAASSRGERDAGVPTNARSVHQGAPTGAPPLPPNETATYLLRCAQSWEPEVRLLGNVRAKDITTLCESVAATLSQGAPSPASGETCHACDGAATLVTRETVGRWMDGPEVSYEETLWKVEADAKLPKGCTLRRVDVVAATLRDEGEPA